MPGKKSVLKLYKEILSKETDPGLRRSIRSTIRRIKSHAYDSDASQLVQTMRKQCSQIKNAVLKGKLQNTMAILDESSSDSNSSESSASSAYYDISRIVGMRIKNGSREYLVRWSGYDSDEDTWEPYAKLVDDDCGDLVAQFHKEARRIV